MTKVRPPPVLLLLGALATSVPLSRLEQSGFDIADYRHHGDGFDAARTMGPDVIVVSMIQGNTDGLDLCRRLQTDVATKNIPLIAITGEAAIGQFMVTLRVNVCDPETLHAEVARLLERRTGRTPSPPPS